MKYLIILLIVVVTSSCLSPKRIMKNCETVTKLCGTETVIKIEKRDTTIYLTDSIPYALPNDTVTIEKIVVTENNVANLPRVVKSIGVINMSVEIKNSKLITSAWLKDSTILIPHRDTVIIHDALVNTSTNNNTIVIKKYVPKFYKFTFWLFVFEIIALAVLVAFKLKGKFILDKINQIKNRF